AAFLSVRAPDQEWPPEWLGFSSIGARATPYRLACGKEERSGTVYGDVRRARVQDVEIECLQPPRSGAWQAVRVQGRTQALFFARAGDRLWVQLDGEEAEFLDRRLQPARRAKAASAGAIVASMHGRVVQLSATVGERVPAGAVLATLEAMKMEHALTAPTAGIVRVVHVRAGEQVAAGRVLIELEPEESAP
ncbi:MAG: hypothetical protein NZL99_08900, partial [Burkholderiaceae bacterium]|nr:hypothetical protein [Burkholderiaceae bacterium]